MNNKSIINKMTCQTKRLFLLFVLGLTFAANSFAAEWTEVNGLKFLIDTQNITATLFPNTEDPYTGEINIPEKITVNNLDYRVVALSDNCFKKCKITKIIIPSSVKTLGVSCFYACSSLTSIELPDGITELPEECFSSANLEKGIKLPKNLEIIGDNCFSSCKFTQITLPTSLVEIKHSAFWNSYLTSIKIPDSVNKIGTNCFAYCKNLSEIKLPSSIEILEDACFSHCSSLESIILPNSITKIGTSVFGCFEGCSKLKEITLSRSLVRIGYQTFKDCNSIKTINCYATDPPTLSQDVFPSEILTSCILNVPIESKAKYKEAGPNSTGSSAWKDFKNIYTLDTPEPGTDALTASITDTKPNIEKGTYYAGNLTYTRTGEYVKTGKYVAQCLPFDINLAETKCFTDVFIPLDIALYNTNTKLLTLMLNKADMTSVIKAGQPFLAKLAEDTVEVKNCNSTYISDDYANQDIETEFKVYDTTGESGVLQRNYNLDVRLGGTYQYKSGLDEDFYRTFMSTGQFGKSDHVLPFRAYVYKANAAAQAAVQSITWGVGDETTGIKYIVTPEVTKKDNKVFTLDGKLVNQNGDTKSLKKGIYIINGRKIIIK